MHVAIDLSALEWNYSGIEQYASHVAQSLVKTSPDDTFTLLFTSKVFPALAETAKAENVTVRTLGERHLPKIVTSQLEVAHALSRIDADAYLFCALPQPLAFRSKRALTVLHDVSFYDCPETLTTKSLAFWRATARRLRHQRALITVSEFSRERIQASLGIDRDRITVAYNGVDDQFFVSPDDVDEESASMVKDRYGLPDRFILSLCTLEPRKNLPFLIDAWIAARTADERVGDLVLAGRKGWKVEELLMGLPDGLKDNVHVTGFIEQKDLPILYSLSTCFVCPSRYEGFGLPPLEALASGTKVFCSDIEVFHETCRDAVTFFSLADTNELAHLLREPDLPSSVRYAHDDPFWQRFSWDETARTIRAVLAGL